MDERVIRHPETTANGAIVFVQGVRGPNLLLHDGFEGPVPDGHFARYLGHTAGQDEFAICDPTKTQIVIDSFVGASDTEDRKTAQNDAADKFRELYGRFERQIRDYDDRITIVAWNPRFTASLAENTFRLIP
jgi:hypothetical protein